MMEDNIVPQSPATLVVDEGFTELSSPADPIVDIVFIHGLQGHPKNTWTYSARVLKQNFLKKLFHHKPDCEACPADEKRTCFWPEDLVAKDFLHCRVATYGYDSIISNFFGGSASQVSILGHGNSLLTALGGLRTNCPSRPIIFVVHSLGGLVLKEALRQSWQAQAYEEDRRAVYNSTIAVIFMGTPHRGSDYAGWGIVLRNIAIASGFDASDRNLRDLRGDSPLLEILRSDFGKMLKEEKFDLYTFQEGKGLKGVRGLTGKVVKDVSSGLDDARERKDFINANHMEMCRFTGREDAGYRKVKDVLSRCLGRLQSSALVIDGSSPLASMYDPECKAALLSLYVPGTRNRQDQVEAAETHTFDWIYDNRNLEFKTWLQDARPLYWIQGKPASGKSTLMKLLCKDPRTDAAASRPDSLNVQAAFFFHDRGSQNQKSFDGLLHSILYQILETVPELVLSILPLYRNKHGLEPWDINELLAALESILSQSRLKLAVYLFLDALDEYSGDHRGMADFLHSINQERVASKTLVKVCFSSRPLQIFLDKFHHVPGFKLQQYTKGDISIVIKARMEDNERFARYLQSSNESDRHAVETIAEDILQRADGVFLWVKLVLDELCEEFRAGADVDQLRQRLLIIPTDLDAYFQRVFDKIPSRYQEDNLMMFEILACSYNNIGLFDFMHIFKHANVEKLCDYPQNATEAVENFLDSADRLIRSRSGGLIEIKSVSMHDQNFSLHLGDKDQHMVQFIHQTVKTFSLRCNSRSEPTAALSTSDLKSNGYVHIFKYILAFVSRPPTMRGRFSEMPEAYDWVTALPEYAKLAERTMKSSHADILSQVKDDSIASFFDHMMWCGEMGHPHIASVLALAVLADLRLFLNEQCTAKKLQSIHGIPLLHLAVHPQRRNPEAHDQVYDEVGVIELLFERGANTTTVFENKTAFQTLFNQSKRKMGTPNPKLIEVFAKHNQDLDIQIVWEERISKRRHSTRRSNPLHLVSGAHDPESVSKLLSYGAKVNALDSQQQTPLDIACRALAKRLKQALTAHLPDQDQYTTHFGENSDYKVLQLPQVLETIRVLLVAGAKRAFKPCELSIHSDYYFDDEVTITRQNIKSLRALGFDVNEDTLTLLVSQPAISDRVFDMVYTALSVFSNR